MKPARIPPVGVALHIPRFVPTPNLARCQRCKQTGARMIEWESAQVWALCDTCGYTPLGYELGRPPLPLEDTLSYLHEASKAAPSSYVRKLASLHLVALHAVLSPLWAANAVAGYAREPNAELLRRVARCWDTVDAFADFFGLPADEVRAAMLDDKRARALPVWRWVLIGSTREKTQTKEEDNGNL